MCAVLSMPYHILDYTGMMIVSQKHMNNINCTALTCSFIKMLLRC